MVQRGSSSRFLFETPQPARIIRVEGWEYFDCNVACQSCVPRPIDFSHTAGTQEFYHLIVSHLGSRRESDAQRRRFEKARPHFVAGGKQTLDFAAQRGIRRADAI